MRLFSFLLAVIFSSGAHADMTGAGDAAIVSQLVAQAKILREQLVDMRETLDVSKRLERMEEVKTVKEVHEEGTALKDLMDETEQLKREYGEFVDDPASFNRSKDEITWLGDALKDAKHSKNKVKAYAAIMADVRRLRLLGKANEASEKKIMKGTNERDDQKITASNTFIMSKILLDNEAREQKRRANNTNIMDGIISNSGYRSLGEESK
jgi:hypothetical protein